MVWQESNCPECGRILLTQQGMQPKCLACSSGGEVSEVVWTIMGLIGLGLALGTVFMIT